MKLWLISQTEVQGYDVYDSAVVAADTEQDARQTHPSEYTKGWDDEFGWYGIYDCAERNPERHGKRYEVSSYDWPCTPAPVQVRLIGEASEGIEAGVICASFNAG